MLVKILLGIVVAAGALLGIIALQPSEFKVTRAAAIAAPPETVFGLVNDFRRWREWSPWENLDPNMKRTFEGSESGEGAKYGWTGNDDVGEGSMTILESRANELVRIKLEFIKPFASVANNEFVIRPEGGATRVEWVMSGTNDFVSKAFTFFMGGMDKAVGGDFEKGLAKLKTVAESRQ